MDGMLERRITDGCGRRSSFEDVIRVVAEMPYWEFVGGRDAMEAAAGIERSGDSELHFDQVGTSARLELVCREDEMIAGEVILYTVLDASFNRNADGFLGQLSETHKRIAATYATSHIQPCEDPSIVATGTLPVFLDDLAIRTTVCSLSTIGFEIGRLHDQICTPVEEYASEWDGPTKES